MRVRRVKELFREHTARYFSGAYVTFAKQSRVAKPDIPLITINTGNAKRSRDSVVREVEGPSAGYYPSRISVTVDLFTHGAPVTDDLSGQIVAYEDTALDDMLAFADYIGSQYTLDWCSRNDIALIIDGDVQDLTGIVNDNNYEYRARMNLLLYFTQQSVGDAGVLSELSAANAPVFGITPSGGGSQELADYETGYFNEVQIKEETGNE